MKYGPILSIMFLSLFSCSTAQKMPEQPLVKVSYTYGSQMIRYSEFDVTIMSEGDSVYAITFDQDMEQRCRYRITEPHLMDTLRTIIEQNKMYEYESHYINRMVLDGWAWNYSAYFEDKGNPPTGTYLSSSGSNARPKNSTGLHQLEVRMKKALSTAEFLYTCNDEGQEIPNVTLSMRRGDSGGIDYLYLMPNDYDGRLDYRFHDIDTSAMYRHHFADLLPFKDYQKLQIRAERCYGARIITESLPHPVLYLIVDNGAAEAIDLTDLAKEAPHTTRHSLTCGLTDIRLIDGKVMGIDQQQQPVEIQWQK